MSREDVKEIMIVMSDNLRMKAGADPQRQFEVWVDMFGNYSMMELKNAAKKHMLNNDFFPTIREFGQALRAVDAPLFWKVEELKTQAVHGKFVRRDWEDLIKHYKGRGMITSAENLKVKMEQYQEAK